MQFSKRTESDWQGLVSEVRAAGAGGRGGGCCSRRLRSIWKRPGENKNMKNRINSRLFNSCFATKSAKIPRRGASAPKKVRRWDVNAPVSIVSPGEREKTHFFIRKTSTKLRHSVFLVQKCSQVHLFTVLEGLRGFMR